MWAVHPEEDRFLSAREFMHLMGLPHDFEIRGLQDLNHIAQNVPVATARDMAEQVVSFVQGKLQLSDYCFAKQDNLARAVVHSERGAVQPVTPELLADPNHAASLKLSLETETETKPAVKSVKPKKIKKLKLTEEKIEIRRLEKEIKREERAEKRKEREKRRKERQARKALQYENSRIFRDERIARRVERNLRLTAISSEDRPSRGGKAFEPVSEQDYTEDQLRFMCYQCKIFPRPGSFNKSELYRHYALVHFKKELTDQYLENYKVPGPCGLCPKQKDTEVTKGNLASHYGGSHCKVEDFLPAEFRLSDTKHRTLEHRLFVEGELKREKQMRNSVPNSETKHENTENRRSARLKNSENNSAGIKETKLILEERKESIGKILTNINEHFEQKPADGYKRLETPTSSRTQKISNLTKLVNMVKKEKNPDIIEDKIVKHPEVIMLTEDVQTTRSGRVVKKSVFPRPNLSINNPKKKKKRNLDEIIEISDEEDEATVKRNRRKMHSLPKLPAGLTVTRL